jgi:hypothetical protein
MKQLKVTQMNRIWAINEDGPVQNSRVIATLYEVVESHPNEPDLGNQ